MGRHSGALARAERRLTYRQECTHTVTAADMTETLNERSREIFGALVRAYLDTGEAVGSKTLSARLGLNLSSATIRNVMADLERQGLLYAAHTSAGRLPTEAGLRFFVHGLLEVGQLTPDEMAHIEAQSAATGKSYASVLEESIAALSGLSRCAGLVLAPKQDNPLKHIEFVHLGPGRALVVMVMVCVAPAACVPDDWAWAGALRLAPSIRRVRLEASATAVGIGKRKPGEPLRTGLVFIIVSRGHQRVGAGQANNTTRGRMDFIGQVMGRVFIDPYASGGSSGALGAAGPPIRSLRP